jgi:hypothetical protein
MFMIDPGATFAAMIVTAAVYYIIKRRSLTAHWGDMRYGIIMLLVQFGIARLARRPPDERTWRPNILVLSGSPTSRFYLVELAAALSHGKGLLTVASVVPTSMLEAERILSLRKTVSAYLDGRGIQAITCVHPAANVLTGARELVRAYGFGPVAPNTFVLGETEKEENFVEFAGLVKEVFFTRRNLVVVREGRPRTNFGRERRIDVWWGGLRQNEGLLLALAWLLRTNPNWADSTLRIRTIVEDAEARESARRRIEGFLERGRLDAEADVLLKNAAIPEMIRECSADASIVFMGLKPPTREESDEEYSRYYADILARTEDLPPTALVLAAEKIEFHRIFE